MKKKKKRLCDLSCDSSRHKFMTSTESANTLSKVDDLEISTAAAFICNLQIVSRRHTVLVHGAFSQNESQLSAAAPGSEPGARPRIVGLDLFWVYLVRFRVYPHRQNTHLAVTHDHVIMIRKEALLFPSGSVDSHVLSVPSVTLLFTEAVRPARHACSCT